MSSTCLGIATLLMSGHLSLLVLQLLPIIQLSHRSNARLFCIENVRNDFEIATLPENCSADVRYRPLHVLQLLLIKN
ncbi:hypothetical protein CEXT_408121 [Caerostris extrusa]|uniref:Secreted protein n=1 Tax=Caerostris extrusa TaxID=172846 RepID=A0AAV4NIQ1_CAEEX|nr:hypothetical protein CEXT_408121 [Caerostris extrusa]